MKIVNFTLHLPEGYKCSEPGDNSGDYVQAEHLRDAIRAAKMFQRAVEVLMAEIPPNAKCSFATAIAVVTAREHGARIIAGLEKGE